MLQKNSIYTDKINSVLLKIKEGELDHKIRKEFLPKPKECDETHSQVVSLDQIFGVFYTLCSGLSTALFILVAEICISYICKATQKRGSVDDG